MVGMYVRAKAPKIKEAMFALAGDAASGADSGGAETWVECHKRNALRILPSATCLPGHANLYRVFGKGWWFVSVKVSYILSKGIALQDIVSFLASPQGKMLAESDDCVVFSAEPGAYVYCPFGWITAPIFECRAAKNDKNAPRWKHLVSFPDLAPRGG